MIKHHGIDNYIVEGVTDTSTKRRPENIHIRLDCDNRIVLGTLAESGHLFLTSEEAYEIADCLIKIAEEYDRKQQS
jgi:hypothetical protein